MAARPSWTGHLRFSLVTIPVQLYSGSKSTRTIPLHLLHKPSMKQVHNQSVVDGIGPVDKKDIVKGYEYQKGSHVIVTPEELEKIRLETNKIINITEFVSISEIDEIYYDRPYYIIPEGDIAVEAYSVFQQALKKTGQVAIGEVVLSGKEHLVSIKPYGKGMLMETLRYANEVSSAHSYFSDLKLPAPDKEQLALAISLIKKKTAPFHVADFDDSYETALQELIERKLKKLPLETKQSKEKRNVVNLMDALRQSLDEGKKEPAIKRTISKKNAVKKKVVSKKNRPRKKTGLNIFAISIRWNE